MIVITSPTSNPADRSEAVEVDSSSLLNGLYTSPVYAAFVTYRLAGLISNWNFACSDELLALAAYGMDLPIPNQRARASINTEVSQLELNRDWLNTLRANYRPMLAKRLWACMQKVCSRTIDMFIDTIYDPRYGRFAYFAAGGAVLEAFERFIADTKSIGNRAYSAANWQDPKLTTAMAGIRTTLADTILTNGDPSCEWASLYNTPRGNVRTGKIVGRELVVHALRAIRTVANEHEPSTVIEQSELEHRLNRLAECLRFAAMIVLFCHQDRGAGPGMHNQGMWGYTRRAHESFDDIIETQIADLSVLADVPFGSVPELPADAIMFLADGGIDYQQLGGAFEQVRMLVPKVVKKDTFDALVSVKAACILAVCLQEFEKSAKH